MESHFTSQFFANNRQKLRQLFTGTAPIVLTANGLVQRRGDSTYAFAQEANFWYLTGIEEPDIILVMDRSEEYLIVPSRSVSRETFDGAITPDRLTSRSLVKAVYDEKAGWDKLKARLAKVSSVATLPSPPAYIKQYGFYTNPSREALTQKIKSLKAEIDLVDLSVPLVNLRVIKQPPELKAIQTAINITAETFSEVTKPVKLAGYDYEYQLEAELNRGLRYRGASDQAFTPIVAGGERACTLHNVSNNGPLTKSDLVIIDAGAEVEHYAADISRTYALSSPTKRQVEVYESVLAVQQFAFSLLKPGVLIKDYEQEIERFMGEQLRGLGLIKQTSREQVRRYYPHATSHFMGLNVHDVGDYSQPLAAGMVLTVEPGIYIKEESLGVRLEDDVLITRDGLENLSTNLPKKLNLS